MAHNIDFKPKDILYNESTKYQIKKFLGQGTYGKVAKCTKLSTREVMAVKIIRRDLSSYGKEEVAILTELKRLGPDKHNLLKILDSFNYMGHICMVFEMLDISLEDLVIITSPLQLSEIRVIAQQMLVALNALKNVPMVHADIKPDNIMLVNHKKQPFKLKMIDFGMAKNVAEIRKGSKIQAIGYRAPEVILGLPLDEAIDMWGLGCVLACLYLGKHLYPLHSEYDVMSFIMRMHGQPEDHLLNAGIYSKNYFIKDKDSPDSPWRFKRVAEYNRTKGWAETPRSSDSDTFNSFDDLARPEEKTTSEYEDTQAFLSLLRRMLHVDPQKRISPSEALGHHFITMEHLTRDTNDDMYVKSACQTIKNCQLETPSVEFEPFVTSSEVISWHGPSPNSSVSSISTNEETAEDTDNGPQSTAAEKTDRDTVTDDMDKTSNPEADKKPPGTNEAAPPASLLSERGKTSNPEADKKPPGTNEAAPPASLLSERGKTSNPEADKKPPGTNEAAPPASLLSERGKTSNPEADKKPPGTNEAAPPASLLSERGKTSNPEADKKPPGTNEAAPPASLLSERGKTSNPEADKKPPGTNEAAPPASLLSERGKTSNPEADKKPPGTNEAAPPASLLREEETGFVEVKSRRKWFKRIRKFFTRMFKSFDCCTETTVKL